MYKSKQLVIDELTVLVAEPISKLILADDEKRDEAFNNFIATLAGYYVRGTADFYNAGVQAERARIAQKSPLVEPSSIPAIADVRLTHHREPFE